MRKPYQYVTKSLFDAFLPRSKPRLSTLIYHRVLAEPDEMRPWEPTVQEFSKQMDLVSSFFVPLSLSDALERMDNGCLPNRALCVTFDDGYADNESVALPVLQQYGVPATVFVSTNYVDSGLMWNDVVIESVRRLPLGALKLGHFGLSDIHIGDDESRQITAVQLIDRIKYFPADLRNDITAFLSQAVDLPQNLMLTRQQIVALAESGIEIGAHTCSHPILAEISATEALSEIVQSKQALEGILTKRIRYFAYPNGKPGKDYTGEHREMVKNAGFSAAVSTHTGVADSTSDKMQLPRFTPWDKSDFKFVLRMAMNARNVYSGES